MANNKDDFQQEERPNIYNIPDNFMNSGRLFNGMIEGRNLFEAAIIAAVLLFIEWIFLMNAPFTKMAVIMVLTVGPIFVVALVGINGDSLSQFIVLLVNFLKNKRKLRYRRIMKNAKTTSSRVKSRPSNSKKKTSRTTSKK